MKNTILHGDCLERLRELEANSVDLICTDPPYGIGFMGKEWDTFKPEVVKKGVLRSVRKDPVLAKKAETARNRDRGRIDKTGAMEAARYDHSPAGATKFREWFTEISVEMLRVLKPGAFAFVCIGARQDSVSAVITAMTEAGFKTDFTSLFWAYASGFPKAVNMGKAYDKRYGRKREVVGRNPNSRENSGKENTIYESGTVGKTDFITKGTSPLEGSYGGFQPKPAVEVIVVAMKPLSEKTFLDQAIKNGKGVTWLDRVRIPATSKKKFPVGDYGSRGVYGQHGERTDDTREDTRFPANLIVSDDILNDGIIRKGSSTTKVGKTYGTEHGTGYLQKKAHGVNINDSGSFSRYFDLDAWASTLPFLVVPKATPKEKDEGLEGFEEKQITGGGGTYNAEAGRKFGSIKSTKKNTHPTVKPIKLMSYLITLGSREGDTVLDPFSGSGTTGVAAKKLGRNYIGIEREPEYVKISLARLTDKQLTLLP